MGAPAGSSGRPLRIGALRVVLLVVVAAWVIAGLVQTAIILVHPGFRLFGGVESYIIDVRPPYDTRVDYVKQIEPGGWRVGDRFLAAAMTFDERLKLYGYESPAADDVLDVNVLRGGKVVGLHLRAENVVQRYDSDDLVLYWLVEFTTAVALAIVTSLVLLRPSAAAWALYTFVVCGQLITIVNQLPGMFGIIAFALDTAMVVVQPVSYLGLLHFGARFPDDRLSRLGRAIAVPATFLVVLVGLYAGVRNSAGVLYPIGALTNIIGDDRHTPIGAIPPISAIALEVLAIGLLAAKYRSLIAPDRAKVRFVSVSLAAYLVSVVALSSALFVEAHLWFQTSALDKAAGWMSQLYILVPIAVLYVVLRFRMVDVPFVFNRALVYGTITAGFVVLLKLVDYFIGKELSSARLAGIADLGVTLAFAFTLERTKGAVQSFLTSTFFRTRDRRLKLLKRLRTAMRHAEKRETVDAILCTEAAHVLEATSAAVFIGDGSLVRVRSEHWQAGTAERIDSDTPLALEARIHREPIRIDAPRADSLSYPAGQERPAVVIPLMDRYVLRGLVFYGGHRNGTDIDAEELEALRTLVDAAAETYEHLEAVALRSEVTELRIRLEAGQTRVPGDPSAIDAGGPFAPRASPHPL